MRLPIVSDTTRAYTVVDNPFGDEPCAAGFYVSESCPVNGNSIVAGPYEYRCEAVAALAEILNYGGRADG